MKNILLILEGLPSDDRECDVWQRARLHQLSLCAARGACGTVRWTDGRSADEALAELWGLPRKRRRDLSRGLLEHAAAGVPQDGGMVYCASFVMEQDDVLKDGPLSLADSEVRLLIDDLQHALPGDEPVFHLLPGGRLLAQYTQAKRRTGAGTHPVYTRRDYLSHFLESRSAATARTVFECSRRVFDQHPVNQVRVDLGENPATALWLWGGGLCRLSEPLSVEPPPNHVVVTDSTRARGLAALLGWKTESLEAVRKENGDIRLGALMDLLRAHDTLYLVLRSPDDGGWFGNGLQTVGSMEQIDFRWIKPLTECLEALKPFRIVLTPVPGLEAPDAPSVEGPLAVFGSGMYADPVERWAPEACASGSLGTVKAERITDLFGV